MKTTAFAIALLMSGAAFAYGPGKEHATHDAGIATDVPAAPSAELSSDPALDTAPSASTDQTLAYQTTSAPAPASGAVVQPGNENPERDARGIKVISAEAMVPAGFNGVTGGVAEGGPELDPATGEPAAADSYPACSATVTDNCLQTYERGREA